MIAVQPNTHFQPLDGIEHPWGGFGDPGCGGGGCFSSATSDSIVRGGVPESLGGISNSTQTDFQSFSPRESRLTSSVISNSQGTQTSNVMSTSGTQTDKSYRSVGTSSQFSGLAYGAGLQLASGISKVLSTQDQGKANQIALNNQAAHGISLDTARATINANRQNDIQYAQAGSTLGTAIGSLGFLAGPAVGVLTTALGSAAGYAVGSAASHLPQNGVEAQQPLNLGTFDGNISSNDAGISTSHTTDGASGTPELQS